MASIEWTEKQTKEVMKKVIRRAEVSRIARLLQHRLALANVKTQNGWENLTLDAIEPKVEEDLKRKRQISSQEKSPSPGKSFFSEGDLDWLRRNRSTATDKRPPSQASDIGSLPTFSRTSKKRSRHSISDSGISSTSKRVRTRRDHDRMIQSSPGLFHDKSDSLRVGPQHRFQPTFHSSPPRTPPRRIFKSSSGDKNTGEEGADLLLYLATSPSPATAAMPKRFVPTTPPSRSSALPSSMMHTPGGPQTPQTGFNFADFVNITPSPAQGAFGSVGRGTPVSNARRRLNFDQLAPPSASPTTHPSTSSRHSALVELGGGGEVVS